MDCKIEIKSIPHDQHRYSTVGDYWIDEAGTLQVRSSLTGNPDYDFLIQIHELVEALCYHYRMKGQLSYAAQQVNDQFDIDFEANRPPDDPMSEPGYCPGAPYHPEHMLACAVEHVAAIYLGVDYNAYDAACQRLYETDRGE